MANPSLRWTASAAASGLYAAEVFFAGRPLAERSLAKLLTEPIQALHSAIKACNLPAERLLRHLTPLSAGILPPRQLAEVALAKAFPRAEIESHTPALAEALRQLTVACQQAVPDMVSQLELRSQPLRSQWEARGPGLVTEMARLTDPELIAGQADVVLVHPVLGGGGRAYLPYNTVVLEAVLVDPNPSLPETLRLGWLLAQLQCELPKFQGELMADDLVRTAAAAMIPAVLAAAEEVELARFDEPTIGLALNSWPEPRRKELRPDAATILCDWWTTYVNARPPWGVAMGALSRMLSGLSPA